MWVRKFVLVVKIMDCQFLGALSVSMCNNNSPLWIYAMRATNWSGLTMVPHDLGWSNVSVCRVNWQLLLIGIVFLREHLLRESKDSSIVMCMLCPLLQTEKVNFLIIQLSAPFDLLLKLLLWWHGLNIWLSRSNQTIYHCVLNFFLTICSWIGPWFFNFLMLSQLYHCILHSEFITHRSKAPLIMLPNS